MTLYLYVQQHQWIVIALLTGVALVLIFCLTYQAMWLPRAAQETSQSSKNPSSFFAWIRSFVPWVIILLVLICVAFTTATVLSKACKPPNW